MTVARLPRFEAHDDDLIRNASFKKIAVDHVSTQWRAKLAYNTSRLGTWLARRAVRFRWESAQSLGAAYSLSRMAVHFEADLTIVHTELPFIIGGQLLAQGRRIAADFEDWHSEDLLPSAQVHRPLRLLRAAERTLITQGAYTSTTSHVLADALHAAFGGKTPHVFANASYLQPAPKPREPGHVPSFFWFSQTVGPGRGLEEFIDAWAATIRPSRLCLLGEASTSYRERLLGRLPASRRDNVDFLPVVPPAELPCVTARQTIGLALESTTPTNRNLAITNKILQYFNAGLAVLASDTAGQREALANAPGAGQMISLDNPARLARELDQLLASPDRIAAMSAAARRAAEHTYCWEKEAPRLISAVESALLKTARIAV